jgi:hypothetical protein
MNKIFIFALFAMIFSASLWAGNIDLVTLPSREGVQLTIYNSEDITLVKEWRFITMKKGLNKLQFSWANTLIDPTSVEFRPVEHASEIEVADTTYPGQKPQHLIWNIRSQFEGQVKVEVMYFTSGLSWHMDYVAITNPEDTDMKFEGFVRVTNNSGEEYENAQVRLIVGKINLVEKIAELARRRGLQAPPQPPSEQYDDMEKESIMDAVSKAEAPMKRASGMLSSAPKAVVKEGLSEYFIFTIEGEETVPNGWSKRMRALKADDVKFDIVYRMRSFEYGPRPVRFLIWNNDEKHNLGDSPLPDGRVRIFRDNGRDGLSFLGEKDLNYVPIKAEIEVNIGEDDFVVYKALKMSSKRSNFHFYTSGSSEYVDGWDEEQNWAEEVRNYRDKPIVFELRRIWDGDVDYASEVKTTLFDYRTTEVKFTVPARGKNAIPARVVVHNGSNAKQSRVELKEGK